MLVAILSVDVKKKFRTFGLMFQIVCSLITIHSVFSGGLLSESGRLKYR